MRPSVRFHADADQELTEAAMWYNSRSPQAARWFLDEIEHAVAMIVDGPERWPRHLHRTRRYILRRFPYAVVYRYQDNQIEVVAVVHLHRRPGYWNE